MKSPDMVSTLQGLSIAPVGGSPQEFQRVAEEEVAAASGVQAAQQISAEIKQALIGDTRI